MRRAVSVPGARLPAEPTTARAIRAHALRRAERPTPPHSGITAGEIPADVRALLPRWTSREAWLETIHALATTETLARLCKEKGMGDGIAVKTWLTAMEVLAEAADTATGELRAAEVALAVRLGRDGRQIRRARRVMAALGLGAEIYRGRDLHKTEREQLVSEHRRHPQRGIPSVWQLAFIPPKTRARLSTVRPGRFVHIKRFVHLPPKGVVLPITHLWKLVTTVAADASKAEAAPPPPQRRGRRVGSALAIELLNSPHQRFIIGTSPGRLAGLLAPYQEGGWRGDDLAQVLIEEARSRKWDTTKPAHAPLAALKTLLSRVETIADPTTAWAPTPCEHCHRSPGRVRELPLRTLSVCTPCWLNLTRAPESACANPACDRGYVTLGSPNNAGQVTLTRCRSCNSEQR